MRLNWQSINEYAKENNTKADFAMVYIREAHASNVWPLGHHVDIPNHITIEDRKKAAKKLNNDTIEILLDTMDNTFDNVFAVWPERYFIIYDGTIQYISSPTNEFGFCRLQLFDAINKIYRAKANNQGLIKERRPDPSQLVY